MTPHGTARAIRSFARIPGRDTVLRRGRSKSFRSRWIAPTVLFVMSDGSDAWSAYLRRMTSRPGWSVAKLARESGIARSTIFRWIADGAVALTIASVHQIADALGDDRASALRAAGNLPPERDAEVDMILASGLTEREKVEQLDRLMERRAREQAQRIADLEWMLGRNAPDGDRTGS